MRVAYLVRRLHSRLMRLVNKMLWMLLIPYCTLAFGIHGGELIQNVNRQLRNLLCAIPFGIVCGYVFGWHAGAVYFALAYGGTSLGFNEPVQAGSLWMAGKGFITCPFGGFITLPLSYAVTKNNVISEYLSGTLYGLILAGLLYVEH